MYDVEAVVTVWADAAMVEVEVKRVMVAM